MVRVTGAMYAGKGTSAINAAVRRKPLSFAAATDAILFISLLQV
jgi:hypothetical protein